jgi:hypothetical protein
VLNPKHLPDDMPYPAGPDERVSSGLSTVFHGIGTSQTPHRTLLAPTNSELPWGDGRVTSGLSVVFHKGKVVVRGREGFGALRVATQKLRKKRGISLERWVNFVHYGA